MEAGDEFIASRNLYGGSVTQFGVSFPKLGWKCNFVDPTDPENFEKAMNDKVKFIFCEGVANPGGVILDLEKIADIAHKNGVLLIVDNTLASPYLLRPFEWGADLVVHSTTKFIGGHGNTMGGILIESGKIDWHKNDKYPGMSKPDQAYHGLTFAETFGDFGFTMKARMVGLRDYGSTLSPQSAWNLLQGVETLPLRMERHCSNAQTVAEWLEGHSKVSWVSYPGLKSNKFYDLANKYLPRGKGAVFTFGVKGGYDAGVKLIDSVDLHSNLANIGDTRSLILHPASTTHRQLTEEQREGAGASSDAIRLSVGIEDVNDIIADLDQALSQV
jgi:O-acetylhomoserine (thiol)-lyase